MLTEDLRSWFTSKGGRLHVNVEIAYSSVDGYYLQSNGEIAASSLIVHCPRATTISIDDIKKVDWPDSFKSHFLDSSSEVLVRFLLVHEYCLGQDSKWWPYLATLPSPGDQVGERNLQTPLYFTEEDRSWLQGTNIEAAVVRREHEWQKEFNQGMAFFKDYEGAGSYSWSLYKWAATVLTSRCFPREPARAEDHPQPLLKEGSNERSLPVLCPVLDAANHDPRVRVTWAIEDGAYTLFAEDGIASGAQIFNNYGPKGNEELLMGYGFTLPGNKSDVFVLSLPISDIPQASSARKVIHDTLNPPATSLVFEEQESWTFYLPLAGDVPPALLDILSLMTANDRELRVVRSTLSIRRCDLDRMRLQALCQLRKALLKRWQRISYYDKSLQLPGNDRQVHTLRYRKGQREILATHIAKTSQKIRVPVRQGQIMSLEYVLTSTASSIRLPLCNLLRDTIGTKKPLKLKKKGFLDVIFTLFICLVGLNLADNGNLIDSDLDPNSTDESSDSIELMQSLYLHSWYTFLGSTYCPPPWPSSNGLSSSCKASNCFCASTSATEQNREVPASTPAASEDDAISNNQTLETAYSIVQRAALLNSVDPIFSGGRWTRDSIRWAFGIWRAEAVVVPTSILDSDTGDNYDERQFETSIELNEEEEDEERALFLETENEPVEEPSVEDEVKRSRKRLKAR